MKVIVAGLPKTGTKSFGTALKLLGYKTYDWLDHFWYLGDDWVRIMRDGGTAEDFRRMYKDVDAVTGSPCNVYWDKILAAFPDAKIILTVRDESSWLQSFRKQYKQLDDDLLFRVMLCLTYSGWKLATFLHYHLVTVGHERKNRPWSSLNLYQEDTVMQIYREHVKRVLQNCPKENLLVMDVKHGWKPLCEFLGVKPPQEDFPSKNKGGRLIDMLREENKIMQGMHKELYISLACFAGLAAFVLYILCSWISQS